MTGVVARGRWPGGRVVAGLAALVTGLSALLVGCTAGAPAEDETPTSRPSPGAEAPAVVVPVTPGSDGPVDDYLAAALGPQAIGSSFPENIRIEDLIAQCMAEKGFEYTPYVPRFIGEREMQYPMEHELGWGTRAFAEQLGFGITTEAWGAGNGTRFWPITEADGGMAVVNPVDSYAETASEEELHAWVSALEGAAMYDPQLRDDPGYDQETDGCNPRVRNGTEGVPFPELSQAIALIRSTVELDGRLAGVRRQWSQCMAQDGFPGLTTVDDAEELVFQAAEDFVVTHAAEMVVQPGQPRIEGIKASAPELLAALQAQEITVAVTSATCREDVGYDRTRAMVDREYQEEFVDAHRAELDAWLAAMTGG